MQISNCFFNVSSEKAAVKAPNKKKHEEHLEEINALIQAKEREKRNVVEQLRTDREQLATVRNSKDALNQERASVFEELEVINKKALKEGDKVQKLRGGIVYQTEQEIDQQIRKLEYQIQKNNFKLADEKRIVLEIDRLNRSKKSLKVYTGVKLELDKLRDQQKHLREQREALFRDTRELRRTEDLLRPKIKSQATQIEALKTEIDELWMEKRSLIDRFRTLENEFRNYVKQRREEQRKRENEERAKKAAEERRDLEELRASIQPYQEERTLINTLINYCHSIVGVQTSTPEAAAVAPPDSNQLLIPPSFTDRRRSSGFSAYTPNSESSSRYATPLGRYLHRKSLLICSLMFVRLIN